MKQNDTGEVFTARQKVEIAALKREEMKRINLYDGSVRSGKTWITSVLWLLWVSSVSHYGGNFLMVGKSLTTLKRNVLDLLVDLVGEPVFSYSLPKKEASLNGMRIFLEGANDARSEAKIRGLTLKGAYCDELTLFPEDFFNMLLSRLSLPGAKLFATTNPDNPNHWLKKNLIDVAEEKELSFRYARFLIDDNTTLPVDYVENLKKEYTGVFYQRYILGQWVAAEGLVYPMFNEPFCVVKTEPRPYEEYYVSIDYGTQHPCAFLLFGLSDGVWYLVKEYYHEGQKGVQKTADEYYNDLEAFVQGIPIRQLYLDNAPIASSFNVLVRKKRFFRSRLADNDVAQGIQDTAAALKRGLLKINDCAKNTIAEFGLYSWNERSTKDEPIKAHDDALDALRYFVRTKKIVLSKRQELL